MVKKVGVIALVALFLALVTGVGLLVPHEPLHPPIGTNTSR